MPSDGRFPSFRVVIGQPVHGTKGPFSAGLFLSAWGVSRDVLPAAPVERNGIMTSTEESGVLERIIESDTTPRSSRSRPCGSSSIPSMAFPRCERRWASPQDHRLGIPDDRASGSHVDPGSGKDREGDRRGVGPAQEHLRLFEIAEEAALWPADRPPRTAAASRTSGRSGRPSVTLAGFSLLGGFRGTNQRVSRETLSLRPTVYLFTNIVA